jgi:hypothetical protein
MSYDSFDHYIYLTVTDLSINEFDKSKFVTYNNFANYYTNELFAKRINNISNVLWSIVDKLIVIFGLGKMEALKYVTNYFIKKLWERYYNAIMMVRKQFGKFL